MIGAIAGDIIGSVYEFNNYCAKDFEPLFHPKSKITDDTVCTVAVIDALLNDVDPAIALRAWCRKYWQVGGWGARFGQWVCSESMKPYGSFGNGAAMRISAAGYLAGSEDEALDFALKVTRVTHDHPEGIKGAQATALAIYWSLLGMDVREIRSNIETRFAYRLNESVDQIRDRYIYTESCQGTVPEALICAFESTSLEDAIRNAISIGGDSDTLAAIAGGVAEARFGLPEFIRHEVLRYLSDEMQLLLVNLYAKRN